MAVQAVELPYGHGALTAHVPGESLQGVLLPRQGATPADEVALLREALAHPIHTARLQEMVRVGLTPFVNLDAALAAALEESGPGASLLVLPQGDSLLPQASRSELGPC